MRQAITTRYAGLARQLGWDGEWLGGGLPDDSGYAFVQAVRS